MIHNGKNILAVALTVGIAMSVPAVNGNEEDQELDNATIEQIYGLNPGEYPIARGSLSEDNGISINNTSSTPGVHMSSFEITANPTKQATFAESLQLQITPIPMAKLAELFSIQAFSVSAATILIPMDIIIPSVISKINETAPLNIYWENIVMVNEISPMERILIAIQTAISSNPIEITADAQKQITQTTLVSIPVDTIQAAQFIDSLTIAIYSTPKINTSDIPVSVYAEAAHVAGYSNGMEFYLHTIQRIQSGASLLDIYMESIEAVGENDPITIFWKSLIFNAMSEAMDFSVDVMALHPQTTSELRPSMDITPIKQAEKTQQIEFVSKYDLYVMCAEWGSPISELAKVIIKKKKEGLNTTKEEAQFNRMIKLQIEYAKRLNHIKKTRK